MRVLKLETATGTYHVNCDAVAWISEAPSGAVLLHGVGTIDQVPLGDRFPLTLPEGVSETWRLLTEERAGKHLRHWVNLGHVLAVIPTPTGTRVRVCGQEIEVIESLDTILAERRVPKYE